MMPTLRKLTVSMICASLCSASVWAAGSTRSINKLNATFDSIEAHATKPTWTSVTLTPYKTLRIGKGIRLLVEEKPAGKSKSKENNTTAVLQLLSQYVKAHMDNDTLVITGKKHTDAKYNVQLNTLNGIDVLDLHDNASIVGHEIQLRKKPLTINSQDSANVILEGMVNLGTLTQSSSGVTKVLWVDAENTNLHVFNGHVDLAGTSKNTAIWAYGDAAIHAPNLRSQNLWLSAAGNNVTYVNPIGYFYAHGREHALLVHRGKYTALSQVLTDQANLIQAEM